MGGAEGGGVQGGGACECKHTKEYKTIYLSLPIVIVIFFFFRFQTGCLCFHLISEIITETRHDKTNKMSVRPAKTQISLGMRPV